MVAHAFLKYSKNSLSNIWWSTETDELHHSSVMDLMSPCHVLSYKCCLQLRTHMTDGTIRILKHLFTTKLQTLEKCCDVKLLLTGLKLKMIY
jgi:hypothetical protein